VDISIHGVSVNTVLDLANMLHKHRLTEWHRVNESEYYMSLQFTIMSETDGSVDITIFSNYYDVSCPSALILERKSV
jgi:hypothetical protein